MVALGAYLADGGVQIVGVLVDGSVNQFRVSEPAEPSVCAAPYPERPDWPPVTPSAEPGGLGSLLPILTNVSTSLSHRPGLKCHS